MAKSSLESAGLLTTIQKIDSTTDPAKMIQPGQQFLNDLGNLITGSQKTVATPQATTGNLEATVYPNIVSGLAGIYLTLALIISLCGLAVVIYLSFNTATFREAQEMKGKYNQLEEKVTRLEQAQHAVPPVKNPEV